MRIQSNPEIRAFLERCRYNLQHESKNTFLDRRISPKTMNKIQREMSSAGFHEFQGDASKWPSLYVSTAEFMNSSYHQNIHLDAIESEEFRLTKLLIEPHRLFNIDTIQHDPKRELNDSMRLRALDKAYEAVVLWQGDEVWMLDVPSESRTIDPIARKAKGKVLCFGLGIGYYVYMALLNPAVESITVIEYSPAVIDLFKEKLLPQFPNPEKIILKQGNAYDYFNKATLDQFDQVFVDIWQSSEDGLHHISALLEQFHPSFGKCDFWIEQSCMDKLIGIIYQLFREMVFQEKLRYPKEDEVLIRKAKQYFRKLDETVEDVKRLKELLYDARIHRLILSEKGN